MAMGVMPTRSATRRMLTASGPCFSSMARATRAIRSAVEFLATYTVYSIRCIGARYFCSRVRVLGSLRTADEPAGEKDQHPADDDLERGLKKRRVHVAMADVANDAQFHGDHRDGDR